MAKQFAYTFVFKAGNFVTRSLLALGISYNGSALITVAGRKTGVPHSTPISMVEFDGQRYVQSPFGSVNWVRNLRSAGTAPLSWGSRHETVTATELSPNRPRRSSSRCWRTRQNDSGVLRRDGGIEPRGYDPRRLQPRRLRRPPGILTTAYAYAELSVCRACK